MTLDEMAADSKQWPMLQDLILSGQIEEPRLIQLVSDHEDFCHWFIEKRTPAWAL